MSDDLIDKDALKAAVTEEDVQDEVTQDTTPEHSEAETAAMERGWVPKDQWKGNPDEWRPAKEFLDRGELIGKIMAQGRELEQLKNAVQYMSQQQKKAYVAGFERAIVEMKARRDAALEEGDLKQAQQLSDKIDDIKDQYREAKKDVVAPQATGPSPTFMEWTTRNPWYGKERALTLYAEAVGVAFKEENPGSTEADMLAEVDRAVRKEFGHRFTKQSAPNPDGEGRVSPRQSKSTGSLSGVESSMTQEQRDIMRTILKTTGMTKEQYLKDFSR